MIESQHVRDALLKQFGLRVGPEMLKYVTTCLGNVQTPGDSIPIIAGNARTGVVVRQQIAASALMKALSSDSSAQSV